MVRPAGSRLFSPIPTASPGVDAHYHWIGGSIAHRAMPCLYIEYVTNQRSPTKQPHTRPNHRRRQRFVLIVKRDEADGYRRCLSRRRPPGSSRTEPPALRFLPSGTRRGAGVVELARMDHPEPVSSPRFGGAARRAVALGRSTRTAAATQRLRAARACLRTRRRRPASPRPESGHFAAPVGAAHLVGYSRLAPQRLYGFVLGFGRFVSGTERCDSGLLRSR